MPALIRGVSIRSHCAQDQLAPQDGLFTVAEREPGVGITLRIVGALASIETGPGAAVDAVASPTTQLVTMTITEKGYGTATDATDATDMHHGATSAPALVAQGLARRRNDGLAAPVVASLDNLLDNGSVLRARVLEAADALEPSLADWIAREVAFPHSVVDRMVPAPTEDDLAEIADALGLIDQAAVLTERHRSWILQSVDTLAPLAAVGVQLVGDVAPYERRKLWLLNGPHSAVAYCGLLAGYTTIAAAVTDPSIARFVQRRVADTLEVAAFPNAVRAQAFAEEALIRFANPNLGHTCAQVGADGSSKLPHRLLPVVRARRHRGLGTEGFAVVTAIWIAATAGIEVRGTRLPRLSDPKAGSLRAAASRGESLHRLSALPFGQEGDASFVAEVASALKRLISDGLNVLVATP
jgi:fructuronate reductase